MPLLRGLPTGVQHFFASPVTKTILVGGMGAGVSEVFGLFDTIPELVAKVANNATWGPLAINVAYVMALFLFAGLVFLYQERGEAAVRNYLEATHTLYEAHGERVAFHVNEIKYDLEIRRDYSLEMTHSLTLQPATDWVFAVGLRRGSANVPAYSFRDLNLSVHLDGGGPVCWVTASDEPNKKRFLFFPDPPIRPGDAARTFVIRSRWPGAAKKLKSVGVEDVNEFTIPAAAVGPVPKVVLSITLPKARDVRYRVQIRGSTVELPDHAGSMTHTTTISGLRPGESTSVSVKRL